MTNELLNLSGSNKTEVLLGLSASYTIQNTENRKLFYRNIGDIEDGVAHIKENNSDVFYGNYEFWYPEANSAEAFICYINRQVVSSIVMSHSQAIARLLVEGSRVGQAIGIVTNVTITAAGYDISELGVAEIPSPDIENGEQMAFISTSPDDNATGDGAREVTIKYIDSTTKTLKTIILPTDGTNETLIPIDMSFVNDFYVSKNGIVNGEYSAAIGDIKLYRFGTPTRIYNIIKALGNKSFTSSRLVPVDKDFYLSSYVVSGNTKGVNIRLRATVGDDGAPTDGWLFKLPLSISETAVTIPLDPPIRLPGGSRLKTTIYGATNGVDASVFLNGTLEPKASIPE